MLFFHKYQISDLALITWLKKEKRNIILFLPTMSPIIYMYDLI